MANLITRSDTQALIPEDVADSIIQTLPMQSAALRLFRRTTMANNQQRMPVLAALPSAGFVTGDTGLKTTTKVNWTNKYLNVEEIAAIVPIPESVLDDTSFDVWGNIKPLMEEAIGIVLDSAIFFGINKPTSWPSDIYTAAVAAGNNFNRGSVGGQDLAEDINQVMKLVEVDGFDVNGFLAMVGLKSDLRGLRSATEKMPIYETSLVNGSPVASLHGERIEFIKTGMWQNASAELIGGDWSQGIVAVRRDLTYKILDQAVIQNSDGSIAFNLAQQDMVALRVVFRVAFQVANPMTRLNSNDATRYPWAVLQP